MKTKKPKIGNWSVEFTDATTRFIVQERRKNCKQWYDDPCVGPSLTLKEAIERLNHDPKQLNEHGLVYDHQIVERTERVLLSLDSPGSFTVIIPEGTYKGTK